jgi:5-oxoprolinase (ATP-hydrolysing)
MPDQSAQPKPWRIWIDTGGTFTDCLALDPSGAVHRAKVLSSGALRGRLLRRIDSRRLEIEQRWAVDDDFVRGFLFRWLDLEHEPVPVTRYDAATSVIELQGSAPDCPGGQCFEVRCGVEAPILAAQIVTRTGQDEALPAVEMRLATTRGTNALLERRGAPVALLVTRGFGDLLLIGDQQRPDLFALHIERPGPLYRSVIEVDERLAADGSEVEALQPGSALEAARRAVAEGVRVAAVALAHAYRNPDHERRLAEMLVQAGFEHVSCSADLSPLIKLLPRAETAVVNAYLAPMIETYLARIRETLSGGRLHVMTSAGGLVPAEACRAKDGLLSGPAGGVAGAAAAAARSGFERVIGLDMGGTSTDVARYDGDYEYQFEHRVGGSGGVRLVAPALAIETVAAGGGSVCTFADEALRVGPESASAIPGPACYGAGGPLTVTDVNLLLGRLDPDRFDIPISIEPAAAMLGRVRDAVQRQTGTRPTAEGLLRGFLDIANERMGDAIAEVSLRRGYDPRDYALVAFGGAGGQHACAVAGHLGIETIVMPADASLLSALGLGRAVVERFAEKQVLGLLDDVRRGLADQVDALGRQAAAEVMAEGVPEGEVIVRRRMVNLRLVGQESTIAVGWGGDIDAEFADRYRAMYGHAPQGTVEVESIRAVASSRPAAAAPVSSTGAPETEVTDEGPRRMRSCFEGRWREVPAWKRADLRPGAKIIGPALVFDSYSAYVIEASWEAAVDEAGALVLCRVESGTGQDVADIGGRPEVVRQELFTNRFTSIARQMGRMLQRTALSTNVKERLDFSCALLDEHGELVVNAPHIPVHLGAIGLCVRALRDAVAMGPGDVVVTNHPAFGGSHLPDVTVVTPIHGDRGELLGYAASRAHHAEIGGLRPGSMPPLATTLAQEGVVIPPQHLIEAGVPRFDRIERLLGEAVHPSRAVGDNLADLRAAVAANQRGARALTDLAAQHGAQVVAEQMSALKARARSLAQAALARFPDGRYEGRQHLDDGSVISVGVDVAGDRAVIDFAGTADRHSGNLNATPAVVRSAVIYVLRLLIGRDLPLNEGIMEAVDVRIPPGMLNPSFEGEPARLPAVGGGNVETSQRIVDALLEALGVCACSQGTMNNVLFGTQRFSYYETVCGGAGAGPGYDGADAVHTHMTNTRITDPEIVEQRYPVRLERFAIRRGSGGAGRHRGGDGVVREIRFLEPMTLSILSQHRAEGPYGVDGGEPGAPGGQRVVRASGAVDALGAVDGTDVDVGDRLIVETPGGGGWGSPTSARPVDRSCSSTAPEPGR